MQYEQMILSLGFHPFISPIISVHILIKMSQYSKVIIAYLSLSKKVNADFRFK